MRYPGSQRTNRRDVSPTVTASAKREFDAVSAVSHLLPPLLTSPTRRNGDVSNNRRCRSLSRVCVLGIKYGHPLAHISGSDLRTIRTAGINLSNRMVAVWHRGKAKINRVLGNPLPLSGMPTGHESTCRLPYDIVEVVIGCITDHITLKACALTCRSWYITTAPHLYHTIVLGGEGKSARRKPLSKLHGHRMPLAVKEIWVKQRWPLWFKPQMFGRRGLRDFSTFANIHTLGLQMLEIHLFTPDIERYFGHFSPTLRSIALFSPLCTPQQLLHFLSIFSNLDDIEIWWGHIPDAETTLPDPKLIPFSSPKLRGRLELCDFPWVDIWTHLATLCGGLRFQYMDLSGSANCAPVLLGACAETLETLRFCATDESIGK